MGNLKFGDISTKDLDLIIQAPPLYEFPERDVKIEHIPGRNGDLIVDNDCYKNVTRTYSIASIIKPGTDFVSNSARLIGWLTSKSGYQRLEDSYDPEVFRLATFKNKGALQNYYDRATALNVSFDCKPQRYLKIGERIREYTFNQVPDLDTIEIKIENPTLTKALPEITINNLETDREYVLMFNTINYKDEVVSSITLSKVPYSKIVIDSENQVVYTIQNETIKSLNKYINLNGKSFPKLDTKKSTLKIEKYTENINEIEAYSNLINNSMKTLFAKYLPFESILESKQEKYTIMSFDKLKESKQEEYAAEAYQNLALDKAEAFSFESFNNVLLENCGMVSFNTSFTNNNQWNKITEFGGVCYLQDPVITIDGLVLLIEDIEHNWRAAFILKASGFENGAFIQLDDKTNSKCNSIRIMYTNTYTIDQINNDAFLQALRNNAGVHQDNILYKLPELNNAKSSLLNGDVSDDIILTIYPSDNSKKLNITYDHPNFMDIEVVYQEQETNNHPLVDKIFYRPLLAGYYYKKSNDGNGLLSGLVGGLISKLFNKTGWSYVRQSDLSSTVLEEIKWDTNKRAFVSGGLLSSKTDYTVSRSFISENDLPQYEDIVLKDTYELDDKGNPKLDAAGNKINKVIKNRISIDTVSDDLKTIIYAKVLYNGYYSFNDDTDYTYYNANDVITSASFIKDTTKSNKIRYLENVPTYESVDGFPEWIDPKQVLYDSNDQQYSSDDPDRINAPYCDFILKKAGWYWYNFTENDIVKRTQFTKRSVGETIGIFNLDPSTHFRDTSLDFAIYYMDYKSDAEVFPVHEYEYVEPLDPTKVYILNENTLHIWRASSTYSIGDYCKYDAPPYIGMNVYKCIQNIDTPEAWDPNKWELVGFSIHASEFDNTQRYFIRTMVIHNMKLYQKTSGTDDPEDWNEDHWTELGTYIKNIGFYYLTDGGKEEEIYLNLLPEWISLHLVLGESEDYSDTLLEFNAKQPGLYKWDTNNDWSNKNNDELVVTGSYKSDTYIYYLNELPQYDPEEYDNLYNLSEIDQSESGNPEKVIIRANVDGYFKIGSSSNYEYHLVNDILFELSINNSLTLVYLEPQEVDQSMKNIKIDIKPRWWSL